MRYSRFISAVICCLLSSFALALTFDREQDSRFLVNGWDSNRPNAYLFLDPLCPYCKKVIPKIDAVQDYNLFVFWAPIFGQRSENAIGPLFNCAQPTALSYLQALAKKRTPDTSACDDQSHASRSRNDEWVSAYQIGAVPSVYVSGRRVSFSTIEPRSIVPKKVHGVAVPWQRYAALKQSGPSSSGAILWFDASQEVPAKLIQQHKPAYVFDASMHAQQLWEISALLGLSNPSQPVLIKSSGAIVSVKNS